MKPLGVIGSLLFIETMLSRSRQLRIRFPDDAGVLNYLVGIGFPEMINTIAPATTWPTGFPLVATPGLRPVVRVRRFTTSEEVDSIANELTEVFGEMGGMGSLLAPCYVVFAELGTNVVAHSGAAGYVVAQRFEYKRGPITSCPRRTSS